MVPSTSAPPTSSASYIIDKNRFSAGAIHAVRAVLTKEGQTEPLAMIGKEEVAICADAAKISTAPQYIETKADGNEYDGDELDSDGAVTRDLHLNIIMIPTHQNARITDVHIHQAPGGDVS